MSAAVARKPQKLFAIAQISETRGLQAVTPVCRIYCAKQQPQGAGYGMRQSDKDEHLLNTPQFETAPAECSA